MPALSMSAAVTRADRLRARFSERGSALAQAAFVTFLWSTSWVLIKIGLQDVPAVTFAGLRYSFAFSCLVIFAAVRPAWRREVANLPRRGWAVLAGLGLLFIAVTQGAQFVALAYLPSAALSLILNFTTVLVALLAIPTLKERLTPLQWAGVLTFLAGLLIYFYPVSLPEGQITGYIAALVCLSAGTLSTILSRYINRGRAYSPFAVTFVTIGVGAAVLLITGILVQGLPPLNLTHWAIIGWLGAVNTAFALVLWNGVLRSLPAAEASVINSSMLIQIALLAWIFLGEALDARAWIGIALASVGILLVQMRRARYWQRGNSGSARS